MLTSCSLACAIAIAFFAGGHGSVALAAEGSSVGNGEGGYVPDFVAIVRRYNASGEAFRIEGTCKLACTLFLGIRNVCVERNATLMFHAGHDIAENVTGPNTRGSLDGHYLDTDAFHSVAGSTIIDRFGYRECPPKG
jgi:hypothetical protein